MQRIIYNIVILSVILTFYNCGEKTENHENHEHTENEVINDDRIFVSKAQFEQGEMTLGSIEEIPFPITIKTNGMIDVPPENRAVVNATMGGYIKTTPLLVGDRVKKGQSLLTIENPDFVTLQQDYMEVNEQLTYLKSEFDRQQIMVSENITSQKSFLQAESAYKSARARHSGLKKQLQMLNISPSRVEAGNISSVVTIYAPIDGSITKVNVSRGTYVSPATAILEIIDNHHLHLELSVFEKDIMNLKKGQKINFKIPEASSKTYTAEVHLIGTAIENNRTIKVHGHIDDEKQANFITGMFVEAAIITDSASAKTLPETAIASIDNENYVLLLNEKTETGYYFEQIEVKTNTEMNNYIEILNTEIFKPNAIFLTRGTFNMVGESSGHEH
ncbi:MAG: efflux RND transporter periplasmic adaptor subunit [Patiriisocius sp.]|uniref:efflux RND transporter periplasmic adaptor subunit n=1 Tax=Patiriisocius sp. TaxID=2822396 RepID=UPI003EF714F3